MMSLDGNGQIQRFYLSNHLEVQGLPPERKTEPKVDQQLHERSQGYPWEAVGVGLLHSSPYRLASMKIPNRKYEWWEEKSQIRRFVQVIENDRYQAAYRLGLECAIRLGENVGLSTRDISFAMGAIHIHRQWLDKQRVYGPTKHNRERYVSYDKSYAESW